MRGACMHRVAVGCAMGCKVPKHLNFGGVGEGEVKTGKKYTTGAPEHRQTGHRVARACSVALAELDQVHGVSMAGQTLPPPPDWLQGGAIVEVMGEDEECVSGKGTMGSSLFVARCMAESWATCL